MSWHPIADAIADEVAKRSANLPPSTKANTMPNPSSEGSPAASQEKAEAFVRAMLKAAPTEAEQAELERTHGARVEEALATARKPKA